MFSMLKSCVPTDIGIDLGAMNTRVFVRVSHLGRLGTTNG